MNRAEWHAVVAALAVWGCAEVTPSEPIEAVTPSEPIEAVRPVEVTGPVEEIARLQARVSELEQQFEGCEPAAPSDGEPAALPEGVDEPPEPAAPEPEPAAPEPLSVERRARRDPSLLEGVLPRRRGDTIELPNPARLLLGDE